MECIFCKIVAGEIPCVKIYEDDDVLAFWDVFPLTRGHALVIPKKHFADIFDIDEVVLGKVSVVAKKISGKLKKSLGADGIRLSQSNGKHAGQAVFHFHLHIIPRYENDGLGLNGMADTADPHPPQANFEELKKLAEKLRKYE